MSNNLIDEFAPDVPPPSQGNSFGELTTGWMFNAYSKYVEVACSSSIHHAIGRNDKTTTQNPRWLYSTKLKALEAMKNVVQKNHAIEIAEIDKRIASERKLK